MESAAISIWFASSSDDDMDDRDKRWSLVSSKLSFWLHQLISQRVSVVRNSSAARWKPHSLKSVREVAIAGFS